MHINLLNNRQQTRHQYNNHKNQNPSFKGGTAVLDYLVTKPQFTSNSHVFQAFKQQVESK